MSTVNPPRLSDCPLHEFVAAAPSLAPGRDGRVSTRIIRSASEIEEIREIWTSWQQHPNADIDSYLLLARLRPEIIRPHIIAVYRGGHPDAMLIGRLMHEGIDVRVGYRSLLRPQARVLSFIYRGLLGNLSPENSQALIAQVLDALRQNEAEAAIFHSVRTDSSIYQLILRSPGFGCRDYFPTVQMHWNMRLPKTVDEVYRGLSPDHRSEIRRKAKKLLSDHSGNVKIVCARESADWARLLGDVEEIAKKTYQRGLGVGFVHTSETRQRLHLEACKGWLRIYVLYAGDKPCAFWMGNVHRETFYSGNIGYNPGYQQYSPGTFLFSRMIEDFCVEGLKEVDFGLGDAMYKQRFGNSSWEEGTAYVFAPNLRGFGLSALRTPTIVVDRALRRALERTKLVPRVKKLWRDHLRQHKKHQQAGLPRRGVGKGPI